MYCPNCGKEINDGVVFCSHCGKQIKEIKTSTLNEEVNDDIKRESSKQLVGIKVLIWINIAVSGIYCLISFIDFIDIFYQHSIGFIYYEGDLISSLLVTIFFGSVLAFFIITLIGLNKGYRYSMITTRISLILWCFSLLGLILVLTIFWKRLNLPEVQQYLHYGYGKPSKL